MSRINNNKISTFVALAISAFLIMPMSLSAVAWVEPYGTPIPLSDTRYRNEVAAPKNNPMPSVISISPDSGNYGEAEKKITIVGRNFVPNSIARVNGSDRPTTFIDYSHLMVQLSASDMSASGGYYITVFNPTPGGGYSNSAFFTINGYPASKGNQNTATNNADSNANYGRGNPADPNANSGYGELASSVIIGSPGFMPSGIIQWVFFAILMLLIVILVRRIFRADEKYFASPLKHP